MKTFLRLLSFAKPFEKFALPYIPVTILSVFFNTLNIALVVPLLQALFIHTDVVTQALNKPEFQLTASYFEQIFYYYLHLVEQSEGKMGALKYICAVIVVSVFLSNFFKYLSQRIIEHLRIHTLFNLRKEVFKNVMNLHVGYFNNERKGDIISKISSDVQVVQFSLTGVLQVVIKEPFQILTYFIFLFAISVKLTLFALLVIPISGYVIARLVKKLRTHAAESQSSYGTMISYLDEALSGIRIIKAFNAVGFIRNRFDKENEHYSDVNLKMSARQQLASPTSEFLGVSMVAIILLKGGSMVIDGAISPQAFIGFIALFSQVMRPAKAITDAFSSINQGIAAGERVLELIDTQSEVQDKPTAQPLKRFEHEITFQNISFSYGEKIILDNISFSIPKGKTVALVGASGGGKSTLMDLLPRFINPSSGKILIDGIDIQEYSITSIRNFMGVVNQESILFNDTIYNNIVFGREGYTLEQVQQAAVTANAMDFIALSEKDFETNIGDRGAKLSGGQRQRLCIARAVLANPDILLLDEATSALDTESEKQVQTALNNLMNYRTALIIAHRLSTIQNADIIIVLDQGKIIEQGTHQELLSKAGSYYRLCQLQGM